jgi:F420-non-reducing hydrogenase iron-sulfur subunit
MCTGRVDLAFILRAFSKGMDGVFIGGCLLGECHYITEGNYGTLSMSYICKRLLDLAGVNPDRLRLEWISSSEGIRFAQVMNDFSRSLRELGPLGKGEGEKDRGLQSKLDAINKLVPYIKLVERERLRVRFKTEEEYNEFFTGVEFERIFQELIVDKLEMGQIMTLLRERPLSTGEISEALDMEPSEASKYLRSSARHGLVRFDESRKRFAPA